MLTSPKFIAGVLSGIAIGAAGSTLYLFSEKGKQLDLRKKVATSIRDMADKAIENIDKAAQEIEEQMESEEETVRPSRNTRRAKTEEPAVI